MATWTEQSKSAAPTWAQSDKNFVYGVGGQPVGILLAITLDKFTLINDFTLTTKSSAPTWSQQTKN